MPRFLPPKAPEMFYTVPSVRQVAVTGCLLFIATAATLAYTVISTRANSPVAIKVDPNTGVQPIVEEFFTDNNAAEMIPIISCESNFRHFEKDGTILKNREGSNAIGVAQIMSSVHPDPKMIKAFNRRYNTMLSVEDFDIHTIEGNLGYALVLYKLRGINDWECAKHI